LSDESQVFLGYSEIARFCPLTQVLLATNWQ